MKNTDNQQDCSEMNNLTQLVQELWDRKCMRKNAMSYDFMNTYKAGFYANQFYDQCASINPKLCAGLMKLTSKGCMSTCQKILRSHDALGAVSYKLFLNVPFCRAQCGFCHYPNTISPTTCIDFIDHYLEQLVKELKWYYALIKQESEIDFIAVGGGTPFLLTIKQLEFLCTAIGHRSFSHAPLRTIESTPHELRRDDARDKLALLKDYGFRRISIGVQAYDDNILQSMKSKGSSERSADIAIERVRQAGFNHINIDLLCGVPGQDERMSLKKAQNFIKKYLPESVTLYRFNHAEQSTVIKKKESRFDPAVLFSILYKYDIFLQEMGYEKYGRHYVHSNKSSITSEKPLCDWLTCRGNWIGVGARSISVIGNVVYQNVKNVYAYTEAIKSNLYPVIYMSNFSDQDMMRRFVVSQIIDSRGIDKVSFQEHFNKDFSEVFATVCNELRKMEACEETDTHFRIKNVYAILDREIASFFATSICG